MPTYLLTWNPNTWDWKDLDDILSILASGGKPTRAWRCANGKVCKGDRVLLLKQGPKTPGLIGSGCVHNGQYQEDKKQAGKPKKWIDVEFDFLLDGRKECLIPRGDLLDQFPEVNWNTQSSGIAIPESEASRLLSEWSSRSGSYFTAPILDKTIATSAHLDIGKIYTRKDLSLRFGIQDKTINTGVFHPNGHNSIWLFVTEEKTSDRTQYRDTLDGDLLAWEGQTQGRTDPLIIGHQAQGLELLLFHRIDRYQYEGAGFRYEGSFVYESHQESKPTRFVLRRRESSVGSKLKDAENQAEDQDAFTSHTLENAREKTMRSIVLRRGQRKFRESLLLAYQGRCAFTGCDAVPALEAAHIRPYNGRTTNHISNGLLLRSDIHTLFDLGLMAVDSRSWTILLSAELSGTQYGDLEGKVVSLPENKSDHPSQEELDWHRKQNHL